jgi:O-antigen ligase
MPFLVAVAAVTFFGCVVAGLDRDAARAMIASAHGALALAAVAYPRTRAATFDFLKRFAWPAGIFAMLIVQAAIMSGAFGFGAADAPYRAEQAMAGLAGLAFAFAGVAGATGAMGRNRLTAAVLWVPLALAVLTVMDWFDGRGDFFGLVAPDANGRVAASFASPNEAATAFALFAVFAAFAAVDELTRRTASDVGPAETLARRLLLPAASFLASFNLLALSGSRAGIAAGVAGLAVFFFIAWRRGQRGRAGPRIVPIAAAVVAGLALVTAITSGVGAIRRYVAAPGDPHYYASMTEAAMSAWRQKPLFGHGLGAYDLLPAGADGAPFDSLRWLAEAGVFGAALLLSAIGMFVWQLWRAEDHGRRPSRGFALAAGLLTVAITHGAATSAMAAPGPASVFAVLLGVAAAYIDPIGATVRVRPSARTKVL